MGRPAARSPQPWAPPASGRQTAQALGLGLQQPQEHKLQKVLPTPGLDKPVQTGSREYMWALEMEEVRVRVKVRSKTCCGARCRLATADLWLLVTGGGV